MYVMPFWSYRDHGSTITLRNEVTGKQAVVEAGQLDALRRLHADPAAQPTVAPAVADLDILFADERGADSWLDAWLPSAEDALPVVDQVELTNRCPYVCTMCPRTTSMRRELGAMPLDLFERVIREITPTQSYTALHHFGESLLHPGIDEAVRIALRHGVRTGLSCNPPSLTPTLGARLLDAGLANVVLSLDSLDPATYRSIRGPAARLDKADRHLRAFVRRRDDGGHTTWITLQMIAMRANRAEIDSFLDYCADVGVDRGVVVRLGRWDFDDDHVERLGGHDSPGHTVPCALPRTSVVVLWDGRVVPCCHDYDGAVVLGSLREQTLAEIWQSPAARRFRERNDEAALCRTCAFSRWFRKAQRDREGFLAFHRARSGGASRYEWTNPAAAARASAMELFDRFDVYTREQG
jgi:radical SAM protein with 4Fe4S-binding SPASM domain